MRRQGKKELQDKISRGKKKMYRVFIQSGKTLEDLKGPVGRKITFTESE